MLNLKMLMYGLISIFNIVLWLKFYSTTVFRKEFDSKRKKNTLNHGKVVFTTKYHGIPNL